MIASSTVAPAAGFGRDGKPDFWIGGEGSLIGTVLGVLVWQLVHLYWLDHWLKDPSGRDPPAARGLWGDVVSRVVRIERRRRYHKARLHKVFREFWRSTAAMPDGVVVLNEHGERIPLTIADFDRDGFLIVEEGLVSDHALELLRERYLRLFDGEYETGIKPDEVNWVPGRDPEDRTRQVCNGWRADTVIAAQVLSERTGRLGSQLLQPLRVEAGGAQYQRHARVDAGKHRPRQRARLHRLGQGLWLQQAMKIGRAHV